MVSGPEASYENRKGQGGELIYSRGLMPTRCFSQSWVQGVSSTIVLLMLEPFSRARWKKSSGDIFVGISNNSRSSWDKGKSTNIRNRGRKKWIDKKRAPRHWRYIASTQGGG